MRDEGARLITPPPHGSYGSPQQRGTGASHSGRSRSSVGETGSGPRRRGAVEDEDEENDRIVLDSFLHWEAEESGSINFQHMLQKVEQKSFPN